MDLYTLSVQQIQEICYICQNMSYIEIHNSYNSQFSCITYHRIQKDTYIDGIQKPSFTTTNTQIHFKIAFVRSTAVSN